MTDGPGIGTPAETADPGAAAPVEAGFAALDAGRVREARASFARALAYDPGDGRALLGLGLSALAAGDAATAERFLTRAEARVGAGDKALLSEAQGRLALEQDRADVAEGFFETAVGLDDRRWRAWLALGRLRAGRGAPDDARTAFAAAEVAGGAPAPIANDIGMTYLAERRAAEAAHAFERALAADPANAVARANLRIARAMEGDYDAALAGAGPDDLPDVLNNVGYVALQNRDYDAAEGMLRRAVEISPVYHAAAEANLGLLAAKRTTDPPRAVAALTPDRRGVAPTAAKAPPPPEALSIAALKIAEIARRKSLPDAALGRAIPRKTDATLVVKPVGLEEWTWQKFGIAAQP